MKTQILIFSLVILLIVPFLGSAKESTKMNTSTDAIAELNISDLETENLQEELVLEDWITDDATWSIQNDITVEIGEQENTLEFETWMVSDKLFRINVNNTDAEKEIAVQDWMTNSHYWRF